MLSKLEKYLSRERDRLDVEAPDDQLIWEGIRKDLQDGDRKKERPPSYSNS